MVKYNKESSFFDGTKDQNRKPCKRMTSLLKRVGGRKGILLSSVILDKPKWREL